MSTIRNSGEKDREEKLKEQALKEQYLRLFLTPSARERLTNVKIVRPEIAEQVENYIIQLGLSGRISKPIDDEQLKEILYRFMPKQREIRFKFM